MASAVLCDTCCSYVTRIKQASHFACQVFGEVGMSFFVAGTAIW